MTKKVPVTARVYYNQDGESFKEVPAVLVYDPLPEDMFNATVIVRPADLPEKADDLGADLLVSAEDVLGYARVLIFDFTIAAKI